jgi:hypothetical protein
VPGCGDAEAAIAPADIRPKPDRTRADVIAVRRHPPLFICRISLLFFTESVRLPLGPGHPLQVEAPVASTPALHPGSPVCSGTPDKSPVHVRAWHGKNRGSERERTGARKRPAWYPRYARMRALTDMTSETSRRWCQSQGWDVPRMARELRKAAKDSGEDIAAHYGLVKMIPQWERGTPREHILSARRAPPSCCGVGSAGFRLGRGAGSRPPGVVGGPVGVGACRLMWCRPRGMPTAQG